MRSADDPQAATGKIAQVMAHIRGRIAGGGSADGARLPSIRQCAKTLGVSTSTVADAFDRLVAEGEIRSRRGSGFFVSGARRPITLAERAPSVEREVDPLWVMRQSLETGDGVLKPGCGWLPETWMPTEAVRRALRAETRVHSDALTAYGSPLGYEPLRDLLARRLNERDIPASPDRVLLTDSATSAIDLLCRLFVRPGDAVLVDDPCYFNFINSLRAHGARIIGAPYTPVGPDLEAFASLVREHAPRLYLTTGAIHNPTGATASPNVQHRLLSLIQASDMVVIEDDVFADFEEELSPRLAALDGLDRVILVGGFSKTLSASLRCGYIAANLGWIEALTDLQLASTFGAGHLGARVTHRLLANGSHRRHVDVVRAKLAKARGEARQRLIAAGLTLWTEPRGGLFLWARLPNAMDAVEVSRKAMRAGVVLAPGDIFSVGHRAGGYLRFNVAQSPPRVFDILAGAMGQAGPADQLLAM